MTAEYGTRNNRGGSITKTIEIGILQSWDSNAEGDIWNLMQSGRKVPATEQDG